MKKLLILATLITLAGCGGGNSLTGSSASKLPNVAGVYAGTLHVDVDNSRVADGRATLTVNQSRASVTITGMITFGTESVELPPVQCQVDATGFVSGCQGCSGNSVTNDPDCGTIRGTGVSAAFHENALDYSESATTSFCGNWHVYGTLTR